MPAQPRSSRDLSIPSVSPRDYRYRGSDRGSISARPVPGSSSRGPTIGSSSRNRDTRAGIGDDRSSRNMPPSISRDPSSRGGYSGLRSRDSLGSARPAPGISSSGSSRGSDGRGRSALPPELGGDATRSRDPLYRREPSSSRNPAIPGVGDDGLIRSSSSRGTMDRGGYANRGVNPRVAGVNAGYGSYSGRNGQEFLPPPPPLPLHDRYTNRYYRYANRHYNNYSSHWFGGHHTWNTFINTVCGAPWFWTSYYGVHTYPWVYGYYSPTTYLNCGWWTPRWYGRVYSPWWDWCDAPFVYYYYRYPARFSLSLNLGGVGLYYDDYDYVNYDYGYYDIYDESSDVELVAVDRPLGVWVPGHWEEQYVVDTEWVWVPGHYVY